MLLAAWRRAAGLARQRPLALLKDGLLGALGLLAAAAAWRLLPLLGAWLAWLAFAWLCWRMRALMEGAGKGSFLKERLLERSLSFGAFAAAASWARAALGFYRGRESAVGLGLAALASALLACAALCGFGLASRPEARWGREWKAAWLMALAYFPQCLAALAFLALLIAAGLPLGGAALAAAYCVALSGAFLEGGRGTA